MSAIRRAAPAAAALWMLAAAPARAQEYPLCTAPDDAYDVRIVSDDGLSAIAVWADVRDTTEHPVRIYAQRLDSGVPQWGVNGVPVATGTGDQEAPVAVSDGAGGVIVAWIDNRTLPSPPRIRAQHLDASGAALWAADGLELSVVPSRGFRSPPAIASDGASGAYVVWQSDFLPGTGTDLWAQHVSGGGTLLWGATGFAVCAEVGDQYSPVAARSVPDNALLVAWVDERAGLFAASDPYIQKFLPGGSTAWATDGIPVTTWAGNELELDIVSDDAGGAVVAWEDTRFFPATDAFAQRVDATGTPLWDGPEAGPDLRLAAAPGQQTEIKLARRTPGVTVAGWTDGRGVDFDIYAQAVSDAGALLWGATGNPISTATGDQWLTSISAIPPPYELTLLLWQDERDPLGVSEVYGQLLTPGGLPMWTMTPDGLLLVDAPNMQRRPVAFGATIASATLVWEDFRTGMDWDLYSMTVQTTTVGVPEFHQLVTGLKIGPSPARGSTSVFFSSDRSRRLSLGIYDVQGRKVRTLFDGAIGPGERRFDWDGRSDAGWAQPSGVYFVRAMADPGPGYVRRLVLAR